MKNPDDARLRGYLGDTLMALTRHQEAVEIYGKSEHQRWRELAICHRALGQASAALEICDLVPSPGNASWHFQRGMALLELEDTVEGRTELRRAIASGDPELAALGALLKSVSGDGDGDSLLDACNSLNPRYRDTAAARGYRALALSLCGRNAEAREIVDLDRCAMRVPFEPPRDFGNIDEFNQRLAEEILRDPPSAPLCDGAQINQTPRTRDSPYLGALRAAIRAAITDYAQRRAEFCEPAALPPPPRHARIGCGTVVLTGRGRNGEHIHGNGYISTVYHVTVPDEITQANDGRGALVLGPCGSHSNGHRAAWGMRALPAVPGWLTLFPSHIFHDVVPTQVSEPRISVVSDLKPAMTMAD